MLKKLMAILMMTMCLLGLSGFGSSNEPAKTATLSTKAEAATLSSKKILIAYFSLPETADAKNSGLMINGKLMGNTEYVANLIHAKVGGDMFRIVPTKNYEVNNHAVLTADAKKEQTSGARPTIKDKVANMEQYDVIFLGYPNWWGDMPMVMYTFLEQYKLDGKTIIPFNTHGGSGLSGTVETIAKLQTKANVEKNAFTIYRSDISNAPEEVNSWLSEIKL